MYLSKLEKKDNMSNSSTISGSCVNSAHGSFNSNDLFSCYFMNSNIKEQRVCLTPLNNTTTFPISPLHSKKRSEKIATNASANVAEEVQPAICRQRSTASVVSKPIVLEDITNIRQPILAELHNKEIVSTAVKNSEKIVSEVPRMPSTEANNKRGNTMNTSQRFKQFKRQGLNDEREKGPFGDVQRGSAEERQKMNSGNVMKGSGMWCQSNNENVHPLKERKMDLSWRRVETPKVNAPCGDAREEHKRGHETHASTLEHGTRGSSTKPDTSQVISSRMIPCANWHQFSVCFEGAECPNSHKIHCTDFRKHVTNYKCKPCVDPALGKQCIYGENCNFVHPGEEIRRPMPIEYVDKQYYTLLLRDCPTSRFPFGIYL